MLVPRLGILFQYKKHHTFFSFLKKKKSAYAPDSFYLDFLTPAFLRQILKRQISVTSPTIVGFIVFTLKNKVES